MCKFIMDVKKLKNMSRNEFSQIEMLRWMSIYSIHCWKIEATLIEDEEKFLDIIWPYAMNTDEFNVQVRNNRTIADDANER